MGKVKTAIILTALASGLTYGVLKSDIFRKNYWEPSWDAENACKIIQILGGHDTEPEDRIFCPLDERVYASDIALWLLVPTGIIAAWMLFWDTNNELESRRNISKLERQYGRRTARWMLRHNTWEVARQEAKLKRKGLM